VVRVTTLRIGFDRGTLRLDGDVTSLEEPTVCLDPRTAFHRAPAHLYASLLGRARARGVTVDDALATELLPRPPPPLALPTLRDYQAQALAAFEAFGSRGVVVLPTGSGKTLLACAAMARSAVSALVLVPTCALLEQWRQLLIRVFGGTIGVVGDGTFELASITVITFASAWQKLDAFGHRFGMIVVDEAHHFAAGLRTEALEMCTAPLRLGLTATPPEPGTVAEARLRSLLGPVVFHRTAAELAGTHLAPLAVTRHTLDLDLEERRLYERDSAPFLELRRHVLRAQPGLDWAGCMRHIARMPSGREVLAALRRATAIATLPRAKLALVEALVREHAADKVLVFAATADDAYRLGHALLAPVISSETPRLERQAILEAFGRGAVRALVSARVLNEGIDVPEASVAIVAGGSLGQREHVQRIGRVLRPQPGKQALVHELVTLDTVDEARDRARRRPHAAPASALSHPA